MNKQIRLFETVKSRLSDQSTLAMVVEELLNIGENAAYRRIRGETELKFSELEKICKAYHLSMDDFLDLKPKRGASLTYKPVDTSNLESYTNYRQQLLDRFRAIKSEPCGEIIFATQDIPFYHLLTYPELAFFWLYVWNDTLYPSPSSFCKFYNCAEKNGILSVYRQIYNEYLKIPSKEIWTEHTIVPLLKLIEYYAEIERFESRDMAQILLEQIKMLMDTVQGYAEAGYKDETPFNMYHCSVEIDSAVLLTKGIKPLCRIRFSTVNSMVTDDESICREMEKWMNDLISKSTLISGASSLKDRLHFFKQAKSKIDALSGKI